MMSIRAANYKLEGEVHWARDKHRLGLERGMLGGFEVHASFVALLDLFLGKGAGSFALWHSAHSSGSDSTDCGVLFWGNKGNEKAF